LDDEEFEAERWGIGSTENSQIAFGSAVSWVKEEKLMK
jgi:hypothetical protein